MAQKVDVRLIDDLDGESEADETISFGLEGSSYEIDLTKANADELREALAPYIAVARRGGRQAPAKGGKKAKGDGPDARDVRAWAQANGHEVPARGRIPGKVVEAYEAAH